MGSEQADLYEILELDRGASKEEIRKAYRRLALTYHPDKVPEADRADAEVHFKEVSQAYEILYDEGKRELYDRHGMGAFDGSARPDMGPDLEDILNSMFGMGMGMGGMGGGFGPSPDGAGGKKKGKTEEQDYTVSLEDLYKGRTVKFTSTKNVICGLCKGKGGKEKAQAKKCSVCDGRGMKQTLMQIAPGMVTQSMEECKVCDGTGSFFQPKDKCKKCKGKKVNEEKKMLEIYIPRGSRKGDKIVLEGEGDQRPNIEPGDIVFTITEAEHPVFRRAGGDLMAHINITLAESLCGLSRVVVKHLDGRGVAITHPQKPGAILRPGQVLRIEGEGMPYKRSDAHGDLYLIVDVQFPADGWAAESMLKQLKELLPPLPNTLKVEGDPVDDAEYDVEASLDDFGDDDGEGGDAWEDDDEEGGAQCTAQ